MTQRKSPSVDNLVKGMVSNIPVKYPRKGVLNGMGTWGSTVDECQFEALGFLTMRMEKDNEAFRQAAICTSVSEALTVQSRWMDEALQDYGAEVTKMLAICTKFGGSEIQRKPRHT